MSAATRRAALGAILAAPLASVPAVALTVSVDNDVPDLEARFLAVGPQLVRLLKDYDRLRLMWEEPYAAWERAESKLKFAASWEERTAIPEWAAHLVARRPADVVDDQIQVIFADFEDLAPTTIPAIMLLLRYAMTYDAYLDEALDALRGYWEEQPLCA